MSLVAQNHELVLKLLREQRSLALAAHLLKWSHLYRPEAVIPVDVNRIVHEFGLRMETQPLSAHGYLSQLGDTATIHVNKAIDSYTRRLSVAHELAHWILNTQFSFLKASDYYHYQATIEEVCDHFGALLLLPEHTFIHHVLSRPHNELISTLKEVASSAKVPIRSVISQLQNSGVLNTLGYAVVVVKPDSCAGSGFKICASAYPRWAFVPNGVDCQRLGFKNFLHHFTAQEPTFRVNEVLVLTERNPLYDFAVSQRKGSQPAINRWRRTSKPDIQVNYKRCLDADVRPYLVGVFEWKRPA